MSRVREVIGTDARGRPITRWADAPELAAIPELFVPANPPGPIERRRVAPQADVLVRRPRTGAAAGKAALGSREHMQQSRMNGARRHVEVITKSARHPWAPPAREESVSDHHDITAELTPLERLAQAARAANDALEEKRVADEAWEVAQTALTAAWRDLPAELLDWSQPRHDHEPLYPEIPTIAPPVPEVHVPVAPEVSTPAKPKRQPGHHPEKAQEAKEKTERAARVMDAMARHGGDKGAVAAELGMRPNAVAMVVKYADRRVSS